MTGCTCGLTCRRLPPAAGARPAGHRAGRRRLCAPDRRPRVPGEGRVRGRARRDDRRAAVRRRAVGALPGQPRTDRHSARCAGRVEHLAVDGDSHPRHRALRSDAGPWRRGPARMTPTLESLATCFQGLLPAQLFTCSRDGIPNAAYLSHVDYVDASHVALSFQFFNKSRRNITENPQALVIVQDPDTGQGWCLRLKYVRSETSGPLFERMELRIEAIASYCGLRGVFKLRAADVYEVLSIDPVPEEVGLESAAREGRALDPIFTVNALQDLSERIHCADSLETLVDSILAGLEHSFGFKYSMIFVPTEEPGVLVTIATRGYAEDGAGAEVRFGEGIGGMVAEAKKPIRISGLMRGMLYAYAMHNDARDPGWAERRRQIPVPGLANPESQLGVPLLVRGELVGVLCLESEVPYR